MTRPCELLLIFLMTCILAIIITCPLILTEANATNLLPNGSFEDINGDQAIGWYVQDGQWGTDVLVSDSDVVDGILSLKVNRSGGDDSGNIRVCSDPVTVQSLNWYEVQWYEKTEELMGNATIGVTFGSGIQAKSFGQGGTIDWTLHKFVVLVPADRDAMRVCFFTNGDGVALYDAVELVQRPEPAEPAPGYDNSTGTLPDSAGFRIGYSYPLVKVHKDDPWPVNRNESIEIALAQNEYETFLLILEPQLNETINQINFSGPWDISMRWSRVVDIDMDPLYMNDPDGRAVPVPDALYPPDSFTADAGERVIIAVDIGAVIDAAPGTTDTTLVISGSQTLTIPLKITVWPFALPQWPAFESEARSFLNQLGQFIDIGQIEQYRTDLAELLKSYRMIPVDISTTRFTPISNWCTLNPDERSVTIDFVFFDQVIDQYHNFDFHGFTLPGGGFQNGQPWLDLTPDPTPGTKFYDAYSDYLSQIESHLVQKGWLEEAVVYPWDEPVSMEFEDYEKFLDLIEVAAPALRIATAGSNLPLPDFYDRVDVWTTNIRSDSLAGLQGRIDERSLAGDTLGAYGNNRFSSEFPLTWQRTLAWLHFAYNLTETSWYSITWWWGGDPWNGIFDHPVFLDPAAGLLLYPPPYTGAPICGSLRIVAIRDGIEDYDLLSILEQRSDRQQAVEMAKEIAWENFAAHFQRDVSVIQEYRLQMARMISQPTFIGDPITETPAIVGESYSGTIADDAADPDASDKLTFSKMNGPLWLVVAGDGSLSGIPESEDVGLNQFTVRVTDIVGATDEASLEIYVIDPADDDTDDDDIDDDDDSLDDDVADDDHENPDPSRTSDDAGDEDCCGCG